MEQLLSVLLVVVMTAEICIFNVVNLSTVSISKPVYVEVTKKDEEEKHIVRVDKEEDSQKEVEFIEYDIPDKFKDNGGDFPADIQKYTYEVCRKYNVDYYLVLALIEVESSYDPTSISHCNAVGYMQVMEKWHAERMDKLNVKDLIKPESNILVGVDYLAELLDDNPKELALSIYNRGYRNSKGTGACDLWEKGIKHTSYSRKVVEREKQLKEELDYERVTRSSGEIQK